MSKSIISILLILSLLINQSFQKIAMAIHAGAIDDPREKISEEMEKEFKQGLKEAIRVGYNILKNGGDHLDAVQKTLNSLENNPIFNSARGAKVNQKFECELDATIMSGKDNFTCGSVAAVKRIKNPIDAARLVMETTKHVLLIGDAADAYAEKKGLTMVPNKYFMTPAMIKEWYDVRNGELKNPSEHETCGALALDENGNLAAGTSTGGITNKMAGRLGDSPIVGAGTYADNNACAISCTGLGENMIRHSIAYDVRARMTYLNETLVEAGDKVLEELEPLTGGWISIDKEGNFYCPYNSPGLARAYVSDNGTAYITLFSENDDYTPIEYDLNE